MMIGRDVSRPYKLTISFLLSLILTIGVKMSFGYVGFLDSMLIGTIQGYPSSFEETIFSIISFVASPKMDIVWILIIAILLWWFKFKVPAFFSLVLVFGGDAIGFVIKHIVAKPRPSMHLPGDTGFSYPSGHVLGAFLVISVLWIIVVPMINRQSTRWIVRTILVIMLFLVMISRVYLNAHFPSDTIGAALIAYTWLQICEYGYVKWARSLSNKRIFQNTIY
ncbi:phosphatase PAP2 family protein [Fructilactobacillus fructivorans]|uniref:Phosphatase PAP2 family protein n=1 Tax=Fructilactobacillus fructivorans TaxID=1614 RepID=A0AAE6P0N9_9LACO|nr:phosphatase PAP2 family protein [Fructilactobacillus fructivorans]KRK57132.1 membrane-associated phospholipid phosphatase [Fructilactobacillus fructivorans]KRN40376.1 membrane-associated phospholipid phosphatase [Fructilactobacillus fructivorans]QFX92378.1 phosphatase PAP2 family protein [Fructilactobacillus fructivorans]RDV64930.1 phosphatase PAP2 family protein [Fructilactobacillus fructivorans]